MYAIEAVLVGVGGLRTRVVNQGTTHHEETLVVVDEECLFVGLTLALEASVLVPQGS